MTEHAQDQKVIATVYATPVRRIFAYGVLLALGLLLVWLALVQPPTLFWQILLIAMGAAFLYLAEQLRRATLVTLKLDGIGLYDSTGTILARMDDIVKVERGAFAFKPSNGFVLHLREKGAWRWLPGLWWRSGRRIGVGGAIPSGPAKYMAEQIALRIAARDRAD